MENPTFEMQNEDVITSDKKIENGITALQLSEGKIQPNSDTPDNINFHGLIYSIEDVPSWYLTFFLGLQHFLTMFGATVSIPYLLSPALCIGPNDPARAYLISTIIFVSGLVTLLQTTFGVRLPILQGGTFSFLIPTFAILSLPKWKCPEGMVESSSTNNSFIEYSQKERDQAWHTRICELQGAIIIAAIIETVIGCLGLAGCLLRFISPLVITSVITLVGLALFENAANMASGNWPIAMVTLIMVLLFTLYLSNINMPCAKVSRDNGWKVSLAKLPIFKLFPVLLALIIMWLTCVVLTNTGVLPANDPARTDTKINILYKAPWIRFPYPFQWGFPTFSFAAALGMLGGVMATVIESIGDYYACAKLSGAPAPPVHAINRGMVMEGLGTLLAGILGTGNGTTSYSENIGVIGVTKVGSRRVLQAASIIMIVFGLLSKFGALFVTIPEPLIGGIFFVTFSMVTAIGLSQVQYVNLNSARNLLILGIPLFTGLAIPKWLDKNKGIIDTGNRELNNILEVLLSTSMFVGGTLALILDNTVPGNDDERGLTKSRAGHAGSSQNAEELQDLSVYNLPWCMNWIKKFSFTRYIPVCPTFDSDLMLCKRKKEKFDSHL